MNIRTERERLGLTQAEFIRKVKPFMGTFALDIKLLSGLEDGGGGSDRRHVLLAAMAKAFPAALSNARPQAVVAEVGSIRPKRNFPIARWAIRALTVVAFVMILISFVWFQDNPYAKTLERTLGLIATIGTIFSAYWATRQVK